MSVSEAKELNPWSQGSSTYNYYCIYGEEYMVINDWDDDAGEYDVRYFPELLTFGEDYISGNNILLRISVDVKSSGIDSINENDFGIELWELETEVIDTYSYSGSACTQQSKYTYQVEETDYYTENECEYDNGLIECYYDSQCSCDEDLIADCEDNECSCREETILDIIFPDSGDESESSTGSSMSYLIYLIPIGLIILILVILYLKLRKRK